MNNEMMDTPQLMLHLLSSIRTIDGRISEIVNIVRDETLGIPEAAKDALRKRCKDLFNTRMCLVYSMMDQRVPFIMWAKGEFVNSDPSEFYDGLMRHAS